jgi:hypothetical protein
MVIELANIMKTSVFIRLFFLMTALLFSKSLMAESVATVDRNNINVEESFVLTITVDDIDSDLSPELSPLHRDFSIFDTRQNSQRSIINGSYSSSTQWFITLIPKRAGKLMIPPIAVGSEVTNAIGMTVTKASEAPLGEKRQELFLDASTDLKEAYVGAQIIFTVKLYHSVNIGSGSSLSDPAPDNAQTKKIAETNYQSIVNGVAYNVVERKYAIYPTITGKLEIPPVLLNAVVTDGRSVSLFGSTRGQNRRIIRRTSSINVTIKELPQIAKDNDAIAAKSLKLHQQWSSDLNEIKVGDSITRNILMIAEGAYAAQLPPLFMTNQDGLKLYSDQPQINDKDSETGIIGQRQESIAIVPTKPGNYTLPEVSAYWFDTKTNKLKKASLPPINFTVAPGEVFAIEPQIPLLTAELIDNGNNSDKSKKLTPYGSNEALPWQIATLIAAALWVITLIYAIFKKGSAQPKVDQKLAIDALTEANAFKKLQSACKEQNANSVISKRLQWAALHWNKPAITHINAVAQYADKDLAALLTQLEASVYGGKTVDNSLYKAVASQAQRLRRSKNKGASSEDLAPLYKN